LDKIAILDSNTNILPLLIGEESSKTPKGSMGPGKNEAPGAQINRPNWTPKKLKWGGLPNVSYLTFWIATLLTLK